MGARHRRHGQGRHGYLPWNVREIPNLTARAKLTASEGDPEPLRNGIDRPIGDTNNGWMGSIGSWVQYSFDNPGNIRGLRFVFDSDLNRKGLNMASNYPLNMEPATVPKTMLRAFRVEALGEDGAWNIIVREKNNYQRLVRLKTDIKTQAVRFIPESTWGDEQIRMFAWDVIGS